MTDLIDDLVEARRPWVSEVIRSWYAEADLTRQLRASMETEAHRFENAEFGQGFRDVVGFEAVVEPLAWANRRLDLPCGGWAVTGIRFRGGDDTRPFVEVVATTESPTPDGLARVVDAVVPAYRAFAPLCLRVDAPDAPGLLAELGDDSRFGDRSGIDMHVVAGLVTRLRDHPRAAAYPDVSVRRGEPEQLAKRVAEIYGELTARQPELAMWAHPEDLESLAECAEEGLLFEVLVDGRPAGVVASVRDDGARDGRVLRAGALPGRRSSGATRRGGGRATDGRRTSGGTRRRSLGDHPSSNLPSLRNALSVGRVHVGGYTWVTPSGLPGMREGAKSV